MIKIDDPLVQQSFQELATYIALPSVSAKHQAQKQTADFLKKLLEEVGAQVQVLTDYPEIGRASCRERL